MAATPGLKALEKLGVQVTLHPYAYDPGADRIGMAAADALRATGGTAVVLVA